MSDNPSAPCMVHPFDITVDDDKRLVSLGMTLRDAFALSIAGGMAAHSGTEGGNYGPGEIANRSYQVADAMLAARTGDA